MKTNLDKYFKVKDEAVRLEIAPGVAFFVRQFKTTNPNFKAAVARNWKPFARQIEAGTLDPLKAIELQVKLFVDTCLEGWEGVEIDGKPAPYEEISKEEKVQFFMTLPSLFEALWKNAEDYRNYQENEDVGNSSADT